MSHTRSGHTVFSTRRLAPGVHSSASIRNLLHACTWNTVLLFDFDSTLARPAKASDLSSEHWFNRFREAVHANLLDKEEIWGIVLPVLDEALKHTSVKPVEEIIRTIILRLQEIGLPCYIITSRGARLSEITERQATELGIKLAKTDVVPITLPEDKVETGKNPAFKNQIIYCDGAHKGHCAEAYFSSINEALDHVVMVDNTDRHLHNTKAQVEAKGGTFIGIHYVHLVPREQSFEMALAGKHLETLYPRFTTNAQAIVRRYWSELGMSERPAIPEPRAEEQSAVPKKRLG